MLKGRRVVEILGVCSVYAFFLLVAAIALNLCSSYWSAQADFISFTTGAVSFLLWFNMILQAVVLFGSIYLWATDGRFPGWLMLRSIILTALVFAIGFAFELVERSVSEGLRIG